MCKLSPLCLFVFFVFLWAKCKRQFSVPFLSCSCSRVDHVCVFLYSWFEQINDDETYHISWCKFNEMVNYDTVEYFH